MFFKNGKCLTKQMLKDNCLLRTLISTFKLFTIVIIQVSETSVTQM